MKQPAMTKHPEGTASYSLRVAFKDGADWQACVEEPVPVLEMIESLEKHLLWLKSVPEVKQ